MMSKEDSARLAVRGELADRSMTIVAQIRLRTQLSKAAVSPDTMKTKAPRTSRGPRHSEGLLAGAGPPIASPMMQTDDFEIESQAGRETRQALNKNDRVKTSRTSDQPAAWLQRNRLETAPHSKFQRQESGRRDGRGFGRCHNSRQECLVRGAPSIDRPRSRVTTVVTLTLSSTFPRTSTASLRSSVWRGSCSLPHVSAMDRL